MYSGEPKVHRTLKIDTWKLRNQHREELETSQSRFSGEEEEMADFEYDEEYYDATPRRREFDELSSDINRQLSFNDAESERSQVMEIRTHVRLD